MQHANASVSAKDAWVLGLKREQLMPSYAILGKADSVYEALALERKLIESTPDLLNGKVIEHVEALAGVSLTSFTQAEKMVLEQALALAGTSKAKCAKLLGISRPTLYAKLKKHGLLRYKIKPRLALTVKPLPLAQVHLNEQSQCV